MSTGDVLGETSRLWLEGIGIRAVKVVDKSWADSDSQVSRVTVEGEKSFFLKRFASSRKYRQAIHAYQNWLVDFEGVVPRLLSANTQERILLLSDVGDCCCGWEELSASQHSGVLFQAGRFLRAFHDIPFVDDDAMPVGDAVLSRAHALQRKTGEENIGADYLSHKFVSRIVDEVAEIVPLLNRFKRVPCHRDFWRRNWIWRWEEADTLGDVDFCVLDFEHSQPDLFVFDFMKLWSDCWLAHPELEQPFWDGYGRMLSDDERTLLKRCAVIHAVQTIIWAAEHQNVEFIAQGMRLLDAAEGSC